MHTINNPLSGILTIIDDLKKNIEDLFGIPTHDLEQLKRDVAWCLASQRDLDGQMRGFKVRLHDIEEVVTRPVTNEGARVPVEETLPEVEPEKDPRAPHRPVPYPKYWMASLIATYPELRGIEMLTVHEAAEYLGWNENTLCSRLYYGRILLPFYKVNKRAFFKKTDLEPFKEEREGMFIRKKSNKRQERKRHAHTAQ